MSKSKILLKVTGSIAVYKAADLVSKLKQQGYEVKVVCSKAATQFVGTATFEGLSGEAVYTDTFAPGEAMSHINLMRWADLVLLCPATANTINKLASGLGDDLISTLFLAHDFDKPYLIAPAMNQSMYRHPSTQSSLELLKSWGLKVLEPESGKLACGEIGPGRLMEPLDIAKAIGEVLKPRSVQGTKAKKVLITSGGTREAIDSVRHIGNASSGGTGAKLADLLTEAGHEVTYVHATDAVLPQKKMKLLAFGSFVDLDECLKHELAQEHYDSIIHAAAVSDFSISHLEDQVGSPLIESKKISSSQGLKLVLKPNHKIISKLRGYSKNQQVHLIGFKLTSHATPELIQAATTKIFTESQANAVVHNDISEIDTNKGVHPFHLYLTARPEPISCENVQALAQKLSQLIERSEAQPLNSGSVTWS